MNPRRTSEQLGPRHAVARPLPRPRKEARNRNPTLTYVTQGLGKTQRKQRLDRRAQTQSIAPNWVHSMDATAMRMATLEAHELGIEHFAMIHDSFGTHAANTGVFAACIRSSFMRLYMEHDPLANFLHDCAAAAAEKDVADLPELPAKGDLDLSLVEASDFFFA
jgi:DNA-directed RNA polymerase, mitochondrial